MDVHKMRTWAEIDIGAIEHNYTAIRRRLPPGARFLGVVKADAYGHGATRVARALVDCGCEYLGVACLSEAARLRDDGVSAPILIFGHTPAPYTQYLIDRDITQTICGPEAAREYSERAGGRRLRAHIKIDTGMCRLGEWTRDELHRAVALPGLELEGIFTHFAHSEAEDDSFTRAQLETFMSCADELRAKTGFDFKIRHCANSGAVINFPGAYLDMIRPGISLYGYYPGPQTGGLELRQAMSVRARVMQVRTIEKGRTVSYGRRYAASRDMTIAVLPVGYADGLHRAMSGAMEVLINGKRARQVGAICMDACMADVTDIPGVREGSVATVLGEDGGERITADDLAKLSGTISHEILTSVSGRVPRIYLPGG
jgi:alanine racemase